MLSWIIKMLLKFMKPLLKIAIAYGLVDTIIGGLNQEQETEANSEDSGAEG